MSAQETPSLAVLILAVIAAFIAWGLGLIANALVWVGCKFDRVNVSLCNYTRKLIP